MNRPKFIVITIKSLEDIVKKIFSVYDEIQLAYLYGSYAKGNQSIYSDIDVGIVLNRDFKEPPLYFAKLSSQIEKSFNYKINIDLKILNDSTPRFLFKLIKEGKVLYVKSRTFMHEFELRVIFKYQEIKPMLDANDKLLIMGVVSDGD